MSKAFRAKGKPLVADKKDLEILELQKLKAELELMRGWDYLVDEVRCPLYFSFFLLSDDELCTLIY